MICRLKELLEKHNISQIGLAQETGLSPGTVGKLARSEFTRIDENTVIALCKYFNLNSISELIEIEWEANERKEAA